MLYHVGHSPVTKLYFDGVFTHSFNFIIIPTKSFVHSTSCYNTRLYETGDSY